MSDTLSLHQQLACAERELRLRHGVYPGLVQRGKMTPDQSRHELAAMGAIVTTLKRLCAAEAQPDLFATKEEPV